MRLWRTRLKHTAQRQQKLQSCKKACAPPRQTRLRLPQTWTLRREKLKGCAGAASLLNATCEVPAALIQTLADQGNLKTRSGVLLYDLSMSMK